MSRQGKPNIVFVLCDNTGWGDFRQWPMIFGLGSDPDGWYNLFERELDRGWMLGVASQAVTAYNKRISEYIRIPTGEEFTEYSKPQ